MYCVCVVGVAIENRKKDPTQKVVADPVTSVTFGSNDCRWKIVCPFSQPCSWVQNWQRWVGDGSCDEMSECGLVDFDPTRKGRKGSEAQDKKKIAEDGRARHLGSAWLAG